MTTDITIRPIQASDNSALAAIIRNALTEFGADRPGTVFYDPTTDALFELFQTPGSRYFMALSGDRILGGGGVFPSNGLPDGVCELVKMYLHPDARGKGLGKLLVERCLQAAKDLGYRQVYLETMPELKRALSLYEQLGFRYLDGPMGNTGHFGCGLWMIRDC
jgi:putative acetyltransferase